MGPIAGIHFPIAPYCDRHMVPMLKGLKARRAARSKAPTQINLKEANDYPNVNGLHRLSGWSHVIEKSRKDP